MQKSIELLKTKLENKLKGKISSFYIGDPYIIPMSLMPCIMINPLRTETNVADNQRDVHSHFINVALVIDAMQFFDATPTKMVGCSYLMETMEKEDSDGNIDTNSILGILRDNLNLASNRSIGNISSIDYTVRKRTDQLITLEAIASLEINYYINR